MKRKRVRTYFEQIPLALVKKIAAEEVPDEFEEENELAAAAPGNRSNPQRESPKNGKGV